MRLAHGGREDPPPQPSTGHASGDESVTPTTELVPGPHSCRSKGVDRGTSTMDDAVFDIKGAVVPSTLSCFEMERPHLADETALERPSVAAGTTETGRAHVATETKIALERPSVGAAETELRRSHVAAGTDLQCTRVANIELFRKLTDSKIIELTDDENHDSPPKPEKRTRMNHIERHRSCVVTLSDIELNGLQRPRLLQTIEISKSPGGGSQCSLHEERPTDTNASHRHAVADAWEVMKRSIVYFRGQPIGTVAAIYKSQGAALNYDQGIYGYPTNIELNGLQPRRLLQTIEISKSPGGGSQCSLHEETPTDTNASHRHAIANAAFEALKRSIVYFRGQLNGTVAAIDRSQGAALNNDQVFMRNFIPNALAFLMKETARLRSKKNMVDLFRVHHRNCTQKTESLLADFGETAIGTVAPADSGLWWITLLRAYTKWTGDNSLAESPNCQRAMHLILRLCLSEGCDTSPALLCADGCSMIDRRMDIYGYPIEIQALFFMAMRCALSLLKQDSDPDFVNHITKRIQALIYHIHRFYRYKTEEYSQNALKKFNVIPESIPDWIFDFMPNRGGYFIGNVSPARMDFRWCCFGNFIAILSSLATGEQAEAILDLVEERRQELIGEMPLKICYPAMENQEWHIVTGCNPKNTRWNYHNRGSWPGIKLGHAHLARRAVELMERRLSTFSKGGGIKPTMVCADSCSMINQIVMKSRIPINDRGSRNCYIVCLDGSDEEILQSYRGAIESIRAFCYSNTKPIDLSSIYGSKIEVFTTPASGTFFLGFEYKNRFLVMSLAGRDLYTMGWRSEHGTFELKSDTQEENYMIADPCTVLDISKQYMFLSPKGKLGNIRIGGLAMKDAFEMLHKCRGQVSYEVMQGIGIFSVHFPEAARIQGVFNDICASFCPLHGYKVTTLDSKNKNSFWVQNWDHYAFQEMQRVSYLLAGKSPPPIKNPKDAEIEVSSESEIFKQILILPRDAYGEWPFEHEARPSPIFECALDTDPSGTKLRKQKGTDKKKDCSKEGGDGGGGDDGGSPSSSLLDEWGVDEEGEIGEDQDDICDYFDQFTEMRRTYWLEFSGSLIDRRALPARDWLPSYAKMRHGLKERTCAQQIKPHTPWRGPVQRTVGRAMSRVCRLVTRFFRLI